MVGVAFSFNTPVDLFISNFHFASKMKTDISDWNNNGVKLIKLKSDSLEVHLLSLGATIHSVIYPGAEEDLVNRDVVLGFDTEAGYDGTDNPFFWGTTGRFTNRFKFSKQNCTFDFYIC